MVAYPRYEPNLSRLKKQSTQLAHAAKTAHSPKEQKFFARFFEKSAFLLLFLLSCAAWTAKN